MGSRLDTAEERTHWGVGPRRWPRTRSRSGQRWEVGRPGAPPTRYAAGRPGGGATARSPGALRVCERTSASVDSIYWDPGGRQGKECARCEGSGAQTVSGSLLVLCWLSASSSDAPMEQKLLKCFQGSVERGDTRQRPRKLYSDDVERCNCRPHTSCAE